MTEIEERIIRWAVLGMFFTAVIGLAITVGNTIAPWVGWAAAALILVAPVYVVISRAADARERGRQPALPPKFSADELSGGR